MIRGGVLGYTAAKIVPGVLTFAAIPVVISVIGEAQYAVLSVATALTLFTTAIGVGWLRNSALRAAGDPSRAMGLLPRWAMTTAVLAPAVPVVVCLSAIGGGLAGAGAPAVLVTAALFGVATGVYSLFATRAQRDLRAGRFAFGESIRAGAGLLAALALCMATPLTGAAGVLAGNAAGTLLAAAVLAGPVRPRWVRPPHPVGPDVLRSYWSYGWPMSLWLAASVGLLYVDRLVLGLLLEAEIAGRYAATADLIVRGTAMLAMPISMMAHPILMIEWNGDQPGRALATLRSYTRVLCALLACCVAGVTVLGPWLLPRLVPGSNPGRGLLLMLAVGAALWQCALLTQKPLEMSGRSRPMLCLLLLAAAVTVGLDAAIVPVLGASGAAVAFASGAACYTAGCAVMGGRDMAAVVASGRA